MQAEAGRRGSHPEPLSESEKRHFSKYGKIPYGESFGSEGRGTLSSGDYARPATENDAIQPRESHPHQDKPSRSGTPVFNAGGFHNGAVGDRYTKVSSTERRLLQQTNSNVQNAAIKEQHLKYVSEEDNSVLFPFD